MAIVRGNPEEMRRFAQSLRSFSSEMTSLIRRIDGQSKAIGQTWSDGQYQKFIQEWGQTSTSLRRFVDVAQKYETHVRKLADRLEEYLNRS